MSEKKPSRPTGRRAVPGARGPGGGTASRGVKVKYSDADRDTVLTRYATAGLAETSRLTGVPKSTIRRWAAAAGVEAAAANAAAAERAAAAAAASKAATAVRVQQAREQLVTLQAQIAVTASAAELEYLGAYRAAVEAARGNELGAIPTVAMARLQAAMSGPRLSELVGAKTRAIHDLQLLDGQATEQPEGGLTVRFATSAPTAHGQHDDEHGEPSSRPRVNLSVVELPTTPTRESA